MRATEQRRVKGLLGVGFDTEDGQIRITQADHFHIMMGSGETHKALQKMCFKIEKALQDAGRPLNDYSPEEFMELIQELY